MNDGRIVVILVIVLVSIPRIGVGAVRAGDENARVPTLGRCSGAVERRHSSVDTGKFAKCAVRKKAPGGRVRGRSSSTVAEPMERTDVEGRPVAYHVIGREAATPVLFINGGPGFDHRFHHLSPAWEQLARSRRVIFFDQPGTGQSWHVGLDDPITIADVLASIDAVRRAARAEKVALLGHSWGGYLALAYALAHPERVERIVLSNSIAPKVSATAFLFGALFPDIAAQRRGLRAENQADVDEYSRLTLAMSFYSPETRDRILSALERPVAYNRRLEILWTEAESRDLTEKVREIAVPVLIVTGRFDANVAPRTAWSIHELIAGSQFVVLEKSGHFPMLEEPNRFARVVDAFLKGSTALTLRPAAARRGMDSRIVFDSNRDGSDEIHVMNSDGSNVRPGRTWGARKSPALGRTRSTR